MNHSEAERTRVIRAWLSEGSTELSQPVVDGVLREIGATTQDRPFWSSRRSGMTTFAAIAAVAATVLVVVVSSGLLGSGASPGGSGPGVASPDAPSPTPIPIDRSYRDVGFIGLPPLGATPSTPSGAVLVEDFWLPPLPPYHGKALLYADGRLIWNEYYGNSYSSSTGWLEQRLTSEGIELVRGLGIRMTDAAPRGLDPALLPTRLPAGAWADVTVRPYVPSGFAACLSVSDPSDPFEDPSVTHSEAMPMLPTDAIDLLRGRTSVMTLDDAYEADGAFDCLGMDLDDARRLDAALRDAGLGKDHARNYYLLEYHVDLDGDGPETWWLNVWFEPILPDGTITCSSCG